MDLRKEREVFLLATRSWEDLINGIKVAVKAEQDAGLKANLLVTLGDLAWNDALEGDLAVSCYKSAFKADKTNKTALIRALDVYEAFGDLHNGIKVAKLLVDSGDEKKGVVELIRRLGYLLMSAGKWDEAKTVFENAVEAGDQNAEIELSVCREGVQAQQRNVDSLLDGMDDNSFEVQVHFLMSMGLLIQENDPSRALGFFKNILAMDPNNHRALWEIQRIFLDGNTPHELFDFHKDYLSDLSSETEQKSLRALEIGRFWLRQLQDEPKASYFFALALSENHSRKIRFDGDLVALEHVVLKGKEESVEKAFERAGELDFSKGELVFLNVLRGIFFQHRLKNEQLAKDAFIAAREISPEHEDVLAFFEQKNEVSKSDGTVDMKDNTVRSEEQKEEQIFQEEQEVEEGHPEAQMQAETQNRENFEETFNEEQQKLIDEARAVEEEQKEKAPDAWRKVVKALPEAILPKMELARVQKELERWNSAADALNDVLNALPENAVDQKKSVLFDLIELYRDHMKLDVKVLECFKKLKKIDPNDIRVLDAMAEHLESAKRYTDLIKVLRQKADLLTEPQEKVDLQLRIARLFMDRNNHAEAVKAFEAVLEEDPTNAEALEQLKEMYEKRRDWEKLISVYEKEIEQAEDEEAKLEGRLSVARLASQKLRRPGVATDLWEKVLESDPQNIEAMENLETFYKREKKWEELAGVCEKHVDLIDDAEQCGKLCLEMGVLFSDRLNDTKRAIQAWKKLLTFDPENRRAQDSLKKLYIADKAWDELEAFYAEQDKWEEYIRVLDRQVPQEEPETQISLLFKVATLWLEKMEKPERAVGSYEKILKIDEKNLAAAEALIPIFSAANNNKKLASVLEIQLEHTEDPELKIERLRNLSDLYENKLRDPKTAMDLYLQAFELAWEEEWVRAELERLAEITKGWTKLLGAYENVLEKFSDPADSLPFRKVVASIYEKELGEVEKALEVNKSILEIAPEDLEAVEALERLYIAKASFDSLIQVYAKKLELVMEEESRREILLKMAQLSEEELSNPQEAIKYYNSILEMGEDLDTLKALDRLYESQEMWEQLAGVLESRLVLIDPEDRTNLGEIKYRLGQLKENKLESPGEAIAAYRDILEMDPLHDGAREALEKRLSDDSFKLEAANILQPIYEEQAEWEKLVSVYEIKVEGQEDAPLEAVDFLLKIGEIWGQRLGDSSKAFDAYKRAFEKDPTNEQARQELVKICEIDENWSDLVSLYEGAVTQDIDPTLRRELFVSLAKIQDTHLDNWEKAVEAYRQALVIDPDDLDSLDALEQLFTRREEWSDLLEIYRKKAEISADPENRETLFFQMAYLQEEMLKKIPEAIETYREIVAADDTNLKALQALDRLYTQQEAWHELADNLTRQLDLTDADSEEHVVLLNRLAELRKSRLGEAGAAVETYKKVLQEDPENDHAIASLEALLSSEEHQLNVAQILEPIYRMRDDWQKSIRVYEVMVENTFDPVKKLELLHGIGELYEIAGDDSASAFATYGRALAEDPMNEETQKRLERLSQELENWEDLIALYKNQAADTVDTELGVMLLTRVAEIYDSQLQDLEKAAESYYQVLEINPERIEAADALESLFVRMDDSARLVQILLKKSDMSGDIEERKNLCYKAAQIQKDVLENSQAAIEIYNKVLEMDESDMVSLDALEGLYVHQESWENLKDVYIKKAELAPTDEERKKMLYVLGQVYDVELKDAPRAIETYRSILDIDPEDLEAIQALDRLYEATENWYELLNILEREEELAQGSAEVVGLKHRMGSLWEHNMEDLTRSVECYREVLQMDPTHEPTLEALDRIVHGEKEPLLAASVLEPVYRDGMDWEKLADVYEVMVKHTEESAQKVELLHRTADLYEQQLESFDRAFDAYGRALEEDPTNEQTLGQLERLADQTNSWEPLAQLYESQLEKILDSQLQISMLLKVARVYEEELEQAENAVKKYERALEHDPECRPAILSLDRLFESMEKWKELTEVLRREIRMAVSDEEMVSLQFRLGQIFEQNIGDMDSALECYRDILTTLPGHSATLSALELLFSEGVKQQEIAEILEPFYTDHGHWEKLVKILEVQLDYVQDLMDRMAAIQRIAEINENQLVDSIEAFRWWGRAYLEDPTSELVVEELERLAAATESWEELVEVYQKAAEAKADDPGLVKMILLRKARICEEQTQNHAQWEEALLKVLSIDEKDAEALAGLDRLYTQAQMYEELASILERRVEIAEIPDDIITLHFRLAEVREVFLEDLDGAVQSFKAVLEEEMRNPKALEGLEKIYFAREQWRELYEVYEQLLDVAAGDSEMADCYARMAKIASDALEDPKDAQQKWHQVLDLRGEDPMALEALADLFEEASRWQDLVEILERQVDVMEEPSERVAVLDRLGRIHRDNLQQDRDSIDVYNRIMEIDPSNTLALWALADLYRQTQAWEELAQTLYELVRIGTTEAEMSDEQLIDLYSQIGELQGQVLMRPDDAIEAWQRVLDLDPGSFKALGELEALFTQEMRWPECVQVLEQKVNALTEVPDKIEVLLQIANIWEDKELHPVNAAEAYERVLELDPSHMMASENVEKIYRENEEWEKLVDILLGRIEHIDSTEGRVEILQQTAKIYEENMVPSDLDSAFQTLLFAFELDYTNEQTASELERLASATNKWNELLTKYNEEVQQLTDIETKCELLVKIGRWYGEKLNHPEYAIASLKQALQLDQNNRSALAGLGDFYKHQGQWAELVQVLTRRSELEEDPSVLTKLYYQIGELYENKLSNVMEAEKALPYAIQSYQKSLQADGTNEDPIQALERLYRQNQQWENLVDILKKKAELAEDTDAVIDIKYSVGEIYEDRLDDAYRAIESYKDILTVDPQHLPALKSLEKLYEKTGQMEEYLDVLEQQLDYVGSDEERITKYNQMAAVWEEHFDKISRSTECYEKILLIDEKSEGAYRNLERLYRQEAQWEDLVDTYSKHINAIHSPADRIELFRLSGEVYERELKDPDRAIDAYRAILDYDNNHVTAVTALARLYESVSDWDNALEMLQLLAELEQDPVMQVDIHHRTGHILQEAMQDVVRAEEEYVKALELDPAYVPSMTALTEIYKGRNDWMKAAKMMITAEQNTNNILERTKLLKDAGVIYLDHLEDKETAKDLLARAVELDPEHVEAAKPLSVLLFEDEEYEQLEPIMDMLVRKSEGVDKSELNDLYYRAGYTAHKQGKLDKALKYYQSAYDIDSTQLPTLKGMAEILYEQEQWDRSFKIYQTMLVHHRDDQSSEEITDIFYRLGNIKQKLGQRKKALNMYEKALEIEPAHRDTLFAVIELQEKQKDWEAVIHAKRALLHSADEDEKFQLLEEIGDVYNDKLSNPQKSIASYQEALEVNPGSHRVLQKSMERYYSTKQWKKAISIIDKFIEMEPDPKIRFKYAYAAAAIFRDELKALDESIEYFNRCLDDNWEHLKAFEAIDKICTQKKDWKALERNYRKMIKRLPPEGQEKLGVMLWHGLGEIYRSRMRNYDSAVAAFEVAAQLDPDNAQRHQILAELYETIGGPEAMEKSVQEFQKVLKAEPSRVDVFKKLFQIYNTELREYDKAWCVASALKFYRQIEPQEQRLLESYPQNNLVRAKQRMGDEMWSRFVFHEDENRIIGAIFGIIAPAVAYANARPLKAYGLKRKDARPLATDKLMFTRLFNYVLQVLNIQAMPDLYVRDQQAGGMISGVSIEKGQLLPFCIAGGSLLQGRNEKELAFAIARELTYLRPEHLILRILGNVTPGALKSLLLSALKLVNPKINLPGVDPGVLQQQAQLLQKGLQPSQLNVLGSLAKKLMDNPAAVDLALWLNGVEATANRAGFVLCNDLAIAANMVRVTDSGAVPVGGRTLDDKLSDLVLYSVSEPYFGIRKELGMAIGQQ